MQKIKHNKLEKEQLLKENLKIYLMITRSINVQQNIKMIISKAQLEVIKEIKFQVFLQCSVLDHFWYHNYLNSKTLLTQP
jgi:hypothetical protein